jgi:hypothetical protein
VAGSQTKIDLLTSLPGVGDESELAMTYVVKNEGGTLEDLYKVRRLLAAKYFF